MLQRVVARDKEYFGLEHVETLASTSELASAWWNQGRLKESEEVQTMDTRKKLLGLEHLDTLTSMDNLASTYQYQGRWRKAEKLHVQLMPKSKVLEPEYPDTLIRMANTCINILALRLVEGGRRAGGASGSDKKESADS